MLRCDGSVVSMHEAMRKPIESVFSGPAASLLGASYLSGYETCAVIDVGGDKYGCVPDPQRTSLPQ